MIKQKMDYTCWLSCLFFFIGQLLAWYQLMNSGYYATTNVANAFFYLFTTLHGLHLIGGLYFWGRTTSKFLNKKF